MSLGPMIRPPGPRRLAGFERRRAEVAPGRRARSCVFLARLQPRLIDRLVAGHFERGRRRADAANRDDFS